MSAVKQVVKSVLEHTGLLEPVRNVRSKLETTLNPPEVTRNHGQCWFYEDGDFHTRVYVYNYWRDNYKIEEPVLTYMLHDATGKLVAKGSQALGEEESLVLDSRELIDRHKLRRPFDGVIVVEIQHNNLRPRLVLQFNIDFIYGGGAVTSVHGQGPLHPDSVDLLQDRMHVPPEPGLITSVVLLNHALDVRDQHYSVSLRNWKGESLHVKDLALPHHTHQRVVVADTRDPACAAFLDGKAGGVEVRSDIDPQRVLVLVENPERGRLVCNHSTGEAATTSARIPVQERVEKGYGPLLPSPVIALPERHTRFVFHNSYTRDHDVKLRLRLYNREGQEVGDTVELVLPPHGVQRCTSMELLRAASLPDHDFLGSFMMDIVPETEAITSATDVVLEVVTGEDWGGVLTGGDYVNCPEAPFSRTKIFSRTLFTDEYRSEVWLCYPAPMPERQKPSESRVMLFDRTGQVRRETMISIQPNGTFFARVDELFPDAQEALAGTGGIGVVKVRDLTCRIMGYHVVRHLPTGTLAIDHLYGG